MQANTRSPQYTGYVYGNTCCGTDVIVENCLLSELSEGDWVYFEGKTINDNQA